MEEHGLVPAQKLCGHTGCHQPASYSLAGEHMYCVAHMREHGQQPMARFMPCEEPGCRRQRRLSTTYERRYCLQHMVEHGMQVGDILWMKSQATGSHRELATLGCVCLVTSSHHRTSY